MGFGSGHVILPSSLSKRRYQKVSDHPVPHQALETFAALGASGQCKANIERDLHRWLQGLWGFELQAYEVSIPLQVPKIWIGFFKKWSSPKSSAGIFHFWFIFCISTYTCLGHWPF